MVYFSLALAFVVEVFSLVALLKSVTIRVASVTITPEKRDNNLPKALILLSKRSQKSTFVF